LASVILPTRAYAVDLDYSCIGISQNDLSTYQAILDEINNEFGTDAKFNTQRDCAEQGVPLPDIRVLGSPQVFEQRMRVELAAVARENRISDGIAHQHGSDTNAIPLDGDLYIVRDNLGRVTETHFVINGSGRVIDPPSRAVKHIVSSAHFEGGNSFVDADVTNSPNIRFSNVYDIYFSSNIAIPSFWPNYSKPLAYIEDGGRPVHAKWTGTLYSWGGMNYTRIYNHYVYASTYFPY